MNIPKIVGFATGAIPIVGILIGGITFGINFKTDVESIKEDVANQETINAEVADWFNSLPNEYDDALVWSAINNIDIPEEYDDSSIITKLQSLALDLTSLQVEVDSIEVGDTSALQSQVSELAGQLSAMANIDMTSDDGTVDLGPLIVRIATVEGSMDSLKSSIDTIKSDIRTMKTDITALERNSGSGNNVRYDDSDLRDMIDDIQWELNNLDFPTTSSNPTDTAWLETLIFDIKNELTWRIDELEWASDDTTTSDDMYVEKWQIENLEYEVMNIQEQVWELQELAYEYENSQNNDTTSNNTSGWTTEGRTWDGPWNEPYGIHLNHKDGNTNHVYTGDFWLDGYWNGEPVWTRWGCGVPPWDTCYIY